MLKTYSQAYAEVKQKILDRNKNININANSVINDVFIVPQSEEIVRQITIADYVQRLQSYELIQAMLLDTDYISLVAYAYGVSNDDILAEISTHIENLASNFDLTRKAAVRATGVVHYARYNALTADITILSGSLLTATSGQQYETLADVIMYLASSASYYDADLNAYAIPISVRAINAGVQGNASVNTVTTLTTPISGIDFVTNKTDIGNGADEETDTALLDRMKLVYSGNNVGTKDGYKKLVLNNTTVTDVYISGTGDEFMERDEHSGGKVDVYIMETQIETATEVVTVASQYYTFLQQPVVTVTSVSSGSPLFEPNMNSNYEGSVLATARLHWTDFVNNPPTVPYTVVYTYNVNVQTVQALLDNEVNRIMFGTSDAVLAKQSIEVPVDVNFNISVFSGYSKASVAQEIITLITTNLSSRKLGQTLQQSDVIDWAYNIAGLDSVILPMTKFNRTSLTGVVDTISCEGREYIRAGSTGGILVG